MRNRPVIVIGAGGHAKVLLDALLLEGAKVLGVLDPDPGLAGAALLGCPVLGGDEKIDCYPCDTVVLVNALGSVGRPHFREQIFLRFKGKGYRFRSVIHPAAVLSPHAVCCEGVQVMAGAVVQAGTTLEDNVIVNTRASIDHDCHIGAHSHIAPGVTMSGGVNIGASCHIGSGATLIHGVWVGEGGVVGAGAVVVKDVPPRVKVLGVPAKEMK